MTDPRAARSGVATIERDGRRFVLVPEQDYQRMIDEIDEIAAIRAYDQAKAAPEEMIPGEIVHRLIAGESPVKVWREHRQMTQQALADAARISTPYLSQLEHGQRAASLPVLQALARALAVDLDDLAPAPPPEPARKTGRRRRGSTSKGRLIARR